ncbi:MAG: glycosyltransferase family 2 protein [Gemmatimonadota bacterium]|nr:glycosyltransferase family 2 protein [Gemmatimonadota bacterium]
MSDPVRISGFSFVRNAVSLDYPLEESLRSILPVVDELVVAVARSSGERDDGTRAVVEGLDDGRVRIVDAVWDDTRRQEIYADLTNAALERCTGDWCLYIQADEVVHEDDLPRIRARAEALQADRRVEGLLFDYLHFFGDYDHLQTGHGWYQREIRMIRNGVGIRSVRDAQSFRYPDQTRLTVAHSGARIFHYGWVRHPARMQAKVREFWSHRKSPREVETEFGRAERFDYGPLGRLPRFTGTHPAVMRERIGAMDWADMLREADPPGVERTQIHKDERLKHRALSAISRWTGIDLNHTNHGKVLDV